VGAAYAQSVSNECVCWKGGRESNCVYRLHGCMVSCACD